MQNSASEFGDSVSEFGVYSSSGRLLQGSEKFKGYGEYGELAKQLDIKRSAFYAEARGDQVLLGCSLLVKIRKGREERAVFMESFPKEAISRKPDWINRFYTDAKTRTEELQSIRYQVLGLWQEGDIYAFSPQESPEIIPDCLEGKVLSGEQVSVRTSDFSGGLFLLARLIFELKPDLLPGFNLALSLYPSRTDVSAGPGELDPDFTLEDGEIRICATPDEKANSKEMAALNQNAGLKEQKEVSDRDETAGRGNSKAWEEARKAKKSGQRKKIVIYACSFSLLLIVGLLFLSKAGLEPMFPSVNFSQNNGTGFLLFKFQLDDRAENVSPELQDLRKENTSEVQLRVSGSLNSGLSNLSPVHLDGRAENVSPGLQVREETNNSSEVENGTAGDGTAGNETDNNENK